MYVGTEKLSKWMTQSGGQVFHYYNGSSQMNKEKRLELAHVTLD
jgi:hypothetical protein